LEEKQKLKKKEEEKQEDEKEKEEEDEELEEKKEDSEEVNVEEDAVWHIHSVICGPTRLVKHCLIHTSIRLVKSRF
jgi:hypothetical protein